MKSPINTVGIPVPEETTNKWQGIVNSMAEIINVPAALIMRVEPPYIEVFRSSKSRNNPYRVGNREHLAGLYCEAVISTKDKLLVPNALKDGDWNKNPDIKLGMISYLGFPLLWPDGEVFGTICVLDLKENSYGERYENLMIQFKEVVEAHLALLYQNQLLQNRTEELKRARNAVQESKERYGTLVTHAPIGLSIIAKDGTYEYVNPKFVEMFGYTLDDVPTGKKWFEKTYPDPRYRQKAIACWIEDLRGGKKGVTRPRTFTVTCNDGSKKEIFFRPATLTDGRQLVTYEDITERKRAEEALRESEERYRSFIDDVIDVSEVGVFILGKDFRVVWVNQALERFFGLQRDKVAGRDKRELISERIKYSFEDPEAFAESVLATYNNNTYVENFECHVLPHGEREERWLEHRSRPIRSGLYTGGRVELYYDVTKRKRAEDAMQRLADEREVVAKIGRIIDSTLEIDKVYELFAEEVRKVIPFDRIAINIIHPETDTCTPTYIAGIEVESRRAGDVIPLAGSVTGEVMRTRSNLLLHPNDINEVAGRLPLLLPALKAGHRSILAVPLISKDQVIGTLHLLSLKPKGYTEADVKLAESIGSQIAGAIANAQLYQELKNQWSFSTTLIDTMPEGMGVLDEKGQLEFGNPRLLRLLGYSSEEILGIHWTSLVHPDDHSVVRAQGKSRKKGQSSTYECRLLRKDGTHIPVLISWARRFDDRGQYEGTVGIIADITERKRAEQRVREYEARYSHLLDHMEDGVALTRRGRIIRVNPPMAQMFGFPSLAKIEGLHVWDLVAGGSKGTMRQRLSLKALRQKAETRFEFQALRKDGQAFPAEATLTIDRGELRPFVLAIIRDLTDRKRYENQRKLLSDRIITAQEKERTLIARELHDELGQALTGIKMDMAWIKSHTKDSDSPVSDRLKALGELIDTTIESVGRMGTNLRPSALDRLGLAAAIEWYGGEFERRTGIECIIESETSDSNLDNKTAINAYRIFQEALTNVARHAGASCVVIQVARDQEYLRISIADNGRSIPPQRLSGPMSLGIAGMRERAELLNGRLDIESQKGKGTKVIAYLPLFPEGGMV
jgi:PAS domain S-box-containing protein